MDAERSHFVRLAGEVRGPLAVEHLRSLAEADLLKPDSEIAASADGPWVRLDSLPLGAEVFPQRRLLNLKPIEAKANRAKAAPPVMVDELKEAALRPPASLRGREVVVTPQTFRGTRDDEPPNEVQQMVQEVGRRVAANAPPEVLPPPPPRLAAWKWFVPVSLLGTAGIFSIPWFYGRPYELFTLTILGGWAVMLNGLLVLVLVLDRQQRDRIRGDKSRFDKLV